MLEQKETPYGLKPLVLVDGEKLSMTVMQSEGDSLTESCGGRAASEFIVLIAN